MHGSWKLGKKSFMSTEDFNDLVFMLTVSEDLLDPSFAWSDQVFPIPAGSPRQGEPCDTEVMRRKRGVTWGRKPPWQRVQGMWSVKQIMQPEFLESFSWDGWARHHFSVLTRHCSIQDPLLDTKTRLLSTIVGQPPSQPAASISCLNYTHKPTNMFLPSS